MWWLTPFGAIEITEREEDRRTGQLTLWSPEEETLRQLQEDYLPTLGLIQTETASGLSFASAPREAVAVAGLHLVLAIDQSRLSVSTQEPAEPRGSEAPANTHRHNFAELCRLLVEVVSEEHVGFNLASPEDPSTEDPSTEDPSTEDPSAEAVPEHSQTDVTSLWEPSEAASLSTVLPGSLLGSGDSGGFSRGSSDPQVCYGGVLLDRQGRVLLCQAADDSEDPVWTFPKGLPQPGETPQMAALREVKASSGYQGRVLGASLGRFEGGRGDSEYFVMEPLNQERAVERDRTQAVIWVSAEQAAEHIGQTQNSVARNRDLDILDAALMVYGQLQSPP